MPVEAAVNMLLARAGFDLLRSAAFKQRIHAQIQKKLDVLRIPEYIQGIEVGTHEGLHARYCADAWPCACTVTIAYRLANY